MMCTLHVLIIIDYIIYSILYGTSDMYHVGLIQNIIENYPFSSAISFENTKACVATKQVTSS